MKRFFGLLIVQTILLLSLSATGADVRLAIGTFGLAPEWRDGNLADLIAAHLTGTPEIDLVERRELNAVLKEAGLSLSGVVRAKDAVRFGALIRADQFLLGSTVPINGTNYLFIRLVDARTGVIRGINVFRDTASLEMLARDIADFVRTEIKRPPQGSRDYLAIGVVQNLGVNNRFSDFPAQMRGSVAAKLSGKVTLLERDVISFLANEISLDTAGLTELRGEQAPQMQFGFWIVDGFYQSYEVAEPEVQLKLRVERVLGGQQSSMLQGKPDDQFFTKICESIAQVLNHPEQVDQMLAPTRQGEIAALEARGRQLADYKRPYAIYPSRIELRAALNPDKIVNTLDEATKVFESILLLDPENNAAKMRLATCLLFNTERWSGIARGNPEEHKARAEEYYREVISTADREYADDARISLAYSCGELKGVGMLQRFAAETTDPKAKKEFRDHANQMLRHTEHFSPVEAVMPYLRAQLLDELGEVERSSKQDVMVNYEEVLFAYRFDPIQRAKIINALLPELLDKFPNLKPYILLATVAEQTEADSPVIAQFLASLKNCEEHPETVFHPLSYFTHLSSTLEEEKEAGAGHIVSMIYQRTFENHQYATVVRVALARKQAAEKGLAPALTDIGKRRLAESYVALKQWKEALELFNELPGVSPQVKNECRSHLGLATEGEDLPDSAWKDKNDIYKVMIAYECIGRKQWSTSISILESMGYRTVRMPATGPWGYAFTPVLPAIVADECRAKAGKPAVVDPMRFELGETPYVNFIRNGTRTYSIEAEGDDLWMAIYSQIKMFRGPGPFAAQNPFELHQFQRTTLSGSSCICISPYFIWAGTEDDGLLELDRKTGVCRRLTVNDGLLLNGISSLSWQGGMLWIAYQNDENGAVGTMEPGSHKFSALTPKLSPEAGANSQPYYSHAQLDDFHQAPQHPISCMIKGEPGEMWLGVADKGLQRFRSSDASWTTMGQPIKPSDNPAYLAKVFDRKHFSQWFTQIAAQTTSFSAIALDTPNGQLLATTRELLTIDNEKSVTGGLIIYNYLQNKEEVLQNDNGLPSNDLTAVAVDGRFAWIGGRGFVAVMDLQERKVLRIAYISTSRILHIQLGKRYAWIQVSCGVDAYPDAGNAWTGVYRIERSAVEPVLHTVSRE